MLTCFVLLCSVQHTSRGIPVALKEVKVELEDLESKVIIVKETFDPSVMKPITARKPRRKANASLF